MNAKIVKSNHVKTQHYVHYYMFATFVINSLRPKMLRESMYRGAMLLQTTIRRNSRINKELQQVNPSPGILLCFIYKKLRCAETKKAEASVGQPKSRQQLKTKQIAQRRYRLKTQYEFERKFPGANQSDLIKSYL